MNSHKLHITIVVNAALDARWSALCGYTDADRVCVPVPFYHCFGMVMGNLGCTTHGATMVIPAPGFDPEITLRTIAAEGDARFAAIGARRTGGRDGFA